ncbi:MAG: S8 family peptidase [Jatrophihabitans sp.]
MTRRSLRRVTRSCAILLALLLALFGAAGPAAAAGLSPAQVQAQQWWINRLSLREVWKISQGQGVTVAVVDSGVDPHFDGPTGDLNGAVLRGYDVSTGGNGQHDTSSVQHGSHIADEIAGRGTGFGLLGVARQAKILPVSIAGGASDSVVTALQRLTATADPPQVVNMSLGYQEQCSPRLQQAVKAATAKGMILVAAAGNEGRAGNPSDSPANCVGVVGVAAVEDADQPRAYADSNRQPYVSLSAPGVHMIGYDDQAASGYGYADGTSDAAAIVSGTFAVVRAHFPSESPRQIVTRVLNSAHQVQGADGTRNDTYGFGVALPLYALTRSVPADAPNPIYDALAKLGTPSRSPTATASGPASNTAAGPSTSPASSHPAAAGSSGSGSDVGLILGIVGGVVLIVLIVLIVVLRNRRRPSAAGPPWDGPGHGSEPWQGPAPGPGPWQDPGRGPWQGRGGGS